MSSTPFAAAGLHGYKTQQAIMGVDITYSRPSASQSVVITKAVPGRSNHDLSQDGMIIEQVKSRDYLILTSALVLGGVQTLPLKGDRITEGSKTYAILAVGVEAQWRYTDQSEQLIRIHTREI
jgi:hypothetical protein